MGNRVQLTTGPLLLDKVESRPRPHVHKVDEPLAEAKRAIARAVSRAITRTGTPYKNLGDKSQVGRWCREDEPENPILHRLWQCPQLRKALVITLAEEAGMTVEITVRDRIA